MNPPFVPLVPRPATSFRCVARLDVVGAVVDAVIPATPSDSMFGMHVDGL